MIEFLLSKRMKSLYWRSGMMCLAVVVGELAVNVDVFAPFVSPATITLLGLILGEISKAINNAIHRPQVV